MNIYLKLFEDVFKKITLKKIKSEEIAQLHELLQKICEIYKKNESNLSKSLPSSLCKDFLDVLCSYYENATFHTKTSIELNLNVLKNAIHLVGISLLGDIISYILDVILDPRQSFWLVYYTIKMLNDILSVNKEAILSGRIIIQDMTQFKLMDFIMLCGDYECQSAMLELIFRLRKDFKDQKVAEGFFPENIDLQYALTIINVENFDIDARFFLNTLNVYGNAVTSVKAETVFMDNRQIMPPMEFRVLNGNNFWIDFNSKSLGVSFHCAKDCLLINSVTYMDEPWEYIFIPNSIVKKIDIKKKKGFYKIEFDLNDSIIVQLESSKDFANKCRNIKFAFKVGREVDTIIDSFLPTIFDCMKKKEPKKLSTIEPQKIVFKPLAIEIKNRSSLGSELPSVKSVVLKQTYLDICSKTVASRSVVSGKQIREVFESGEEDSNTVNDIHNLTTKITDSEVLEDINQLQKNISEINTYLSKDNLKKHSNQYIKAQIKRNVKPRRRPPSTLDSISENEETYYVTKSYETFKDNLVANSSPVSSNSSKKVISSNYISIPELQRNDNNGIKDSIMLEKDLSDSCEPSIILETQSPKFYSQATNDYGMNIKNISISELDDFEDFFEEIIYSNDIIGKDVKNIENKDIKETYLTTNFDSNSKTSIGKENIVLTSNEDNEVIDTATKTKKNKGEVLKAIDERSWKKIKEQANLIPKTKDEQENRINKERSEPKTNEEVLAKESIDNKTKDVGSITNPLKVEGKQEFSQNLGFKVEEKVKKKRGRKSTKNNFDNSTTPQSKIYKKNIESVDRNVKDVQNNSFSEETKELEIKLAEKKNRGKISIPRIKKTKEITVNKTSENINNIECKNKNSLESCIIDKNIEGNGMDVSQMNKMKIESYKFNNSTNLNNKILQIKLHDICGSKGINETNSKDSSIDLLPENIQKLEQCELNINNIQEQELDNEDDKSMELNSYPKKSNSKIIIKEIYILPNKNEKKESEKKGQHKKSVIQKNKIFSKRSTRIKKKETIKENQEKEIEEDNQLSGKNINENTLNLISPEEIKSCTNGKYNEHTLCKVSKNRTIAHSNLPVVEENIEVTPVKRVRRNKGLSLKPKSNDKLSMETNESCNKEIVQEKIADEIDNDKNNILPSDDKIEQEECFDNNKNNDDLEKSQSLHTINYLDLSKENDVSEGPPESTRDVEKTFDIDSVSRQGEYLDMDNESMGNKSRLNDSINSSKISLMAKTYIDIIKKKEMINKKSETNLNKSDSIIKGNKIIPNKRTRRLYNPNDTSSLLFDNLSKDKQNISIDTELSTQKKGFTNKESAGNKDLIDIKENSKNELILPIKDKNYLDEKDVNTSRDLKKMYEERVRIVKSINLQYEEDSEFEDEHRDIGELDYIDNPYKLKEDSDLKKLYEERKTYYDSCFDALLGKNDKDVNNTKEDNNENNSITNPNIFTEKTEKKVERENRSKQLEKLGEENVAVGDEDGIDKIKIDNELNDMERKNKCQKINDLMKECNKCIDTILNSEDNQPKETTEGNKSKNKKAKIAKKTNKKYKKSIIKEGQNEENILKTRKTENVMDEEENESVMFCNEKNEDIQTKNLVMEDVEEYKNHNNEEETINKLETQNIDNDQGRSIMPNRGKLTSVKRKRDPFDSIFNKRSKKIKETHTVDKSILENNSAELDNSTFFDSLFKEKKSNWFNKPEANSRLSRNNRRSSRILKKSDEIEGKLQKRVALLKEIRDKNADIKNIDKGEVKCGYTQIMKHAEALCVSREIIKTEIINQKFLLKSVFQICREMINEN